MTDESDPYAELDPHERDLAERLRADRPLPAAGFRGALGRYLVESDPGYGPRPESLRIAVAASVAAGGGVIAIGVLQATGVL